MRAKIPAREKLSNRGLNIHIQRVRNHRTAKERPSRELIARKNHSVCASFGLKHSGSRSSESIRSSDRYGRERQKGDPGRTPIRPRSRTTDSRALAVQIGAAPRPGGRGGPFGSAQSAVYRQPATVAFHGVPKGLASSPSQVRPSPRHKLY